MGSHVCCAALLAPFVLTGLAVIAVIAVHHVTSCHCTAQHCALGFSAAKYKVSAYEIVTSTAFNMHKGKCESQTTVHMGPELLCTQD